MMDTAQESSCGTKGSSMTAVGGFTVDLAVSHLRFCAFFGRGGATFLTGGLSFLVSPNLNALPMTALRVYLDAS